MVSKYTRRHAGQHRDDLTGEHAFGDAGQLLLFFLFLAVWITDIVFRYSTLLNDYVPLAVRLTLGISLLLLSGYMAWAGMRIVFGKVRKTPGVIRQGIFGVVRHPIYLSEVMLYLGLILIHISLAALGVWVMAGLFLHYISRHEEKLLLARFGDNYAAYMRDVPMYLPRLFGRRPKV